MKVKFVLILMLSLLFSACGSHKNGTNDIKTNSTQDDINKSIGYYTDSGIVGVDYVCGALSGKTGKDGMFYFYYEKDKGCVFSFAGIILKEVSSDDLLKDSIVVEINTNVGRMLQILDNDGNSTNDLTMTDSVEAQLKSAGITQVPSIEDEFKKLFEAAKLASGYDGKFVTNQEAIAHMNEGVIDNIPPVISLRGADKVTINFGDKYIDMGATASDNIDGDLSHKIKISGIIDTHNEGNYTISFNVKDTAGNEAVEVKRTVIVKRIEPVEDDFTKLSVDLINDTFYNNRQDLLDIDYNKGILVSKDGSKFYILHSNFTNMSKKMSIIDSNSLTTLGSLDIFGFSMTLSDDETKAYVRDFDNIKIIDISNPQLPKILGLIEIKSDGSNSESIFLSKDNTKAYIQDNKIIKIIDVSNSEVPLQLGVFNTEGVLKLISKDNTKAYIVDKMGISIIDISNPKIPELMGSFDDTDIDIFFDDVLLSNDETKMYVVDNNGMKIIDISNPKIPKLMGSFNDVNIGKILLSNDETKMYFANYNQNSKIKIIDISNPKVPKLISSFDVDSGYYVMDIIMSNDKTKIYFTCSNPSGDGKMEILDVSNLAKPKLLGYFDTTGFDMSLFNNETKIVLKGMDYGAYILDLTSFYINKLANFGDSNLEFKITNSANIPLDISVTADRDDIISIGGYNYKEGTLKIPISSITGETGTTIITVKITNGDKKPIIRTIYLNILKIRV